MERLSPAAGLSILICYLQWTLRMIWLFASHRETQRWKKNIKPLETKQFLSEVITTDGCTVIMRYAEKPVPGVIEKVKYDPANRLTLTTGGRKLDGIVDRMVRYQLSKISTESGEDIVAKQNQKAIESAKARHHLATVQLAEKQKSKKDGCFPIH